MKNNSATVKWIYNRTKSALPNVILISLLGAVVSIIYVLLAHISKGIIDGAANSENVIILGGFLLFVLIIVQLAFESIISMVSVRTSNALNVFLKNYIFSTLLQKKYSKVSEYHSGDLLNRFVSDVEQVVSGCINIIPSLVSMLTKIIAGFTALCLQNYLFAIAVLIVGFFFPLLGRIVSKYYKALHKKVHQTEGETRSFIQECFANIIVVKTFSGEKTLHEKFNELLKINNDLRIKRNYLSVLISISMHLFFTLGYYLILLWGALGIASGYLSVGTLIYFLQLISMLRAPLQNISGVLPRYYSMTASAERLIELENLPNEAKSPKKKQIFDFNNIIVDNLTFAYDKEIVLKNCSFGIHKNSITALVGESGSGKSTLFKLLLGLYEPTAGTITFDGETLIGDTTRCMFSYVPQGNMVLSGSIRENITLSDNSITDDEIIRAAKAADIYDFIQSLPNGFDTLVSERGLGLSEGQLQRIAIARALLFDAPILLLDEATSALDEKTESRLLDNLKKITDKTIILITHRNTSLDRCDNVLQLKNGTFVSQ